MRRRIILSENMLHSVVREAVSRILSEVYVDHFTPYTESDREENMSGLFAEHPWKSNPTYGIIMMRKNGWTEEEIENYLGKRVYDLYKTAKRPEY